MTCCDLVFNTGRTGNVRSRKKVAQDMTKQQVKERRIPRSVDEAAQMLFSDFLSQHLQVLARMPDGDLEKLCRKFLPQIEAVSHHQGPDCHFAETENGPLINDDGDSIRPILDRMKDLLNEFRGLFILT